MNRDLADLSFSRRILSEITLFPPAWNWTSAQTSPFQEEGPKPFYQGRFWTRIALWPKLPQNATSIWLATLRTLGVFATAESPSFSDLPLNRIPKRVLPIYPDSFPAPEEFDTADAIELQLMVPQTLPPPSTPSGWWKRQLPYDATSLTMLVKKLDAIRYSLPHPLPVGIAITKGRIDEDFPMIVRAKPDFVSIVDGNFPRNEPSVPDCWYAQRSRKLAAESDQASLPIFIEADVETGDEAIKLLAMGATAITVDSIFHRVNEEFRKSNQRESYSSGLGGLSLPTSTMAPTAKLEQSFSAEIQRLQGEMKQILESQQISSVQEVRSEWLVALTPDAARLTGLPLLGG